MGRFEVVEYLVTKDAAVNAKDTYGQTPLMDAAGNGNLEVVKFLKLHGAKE